MSGIRRLLSCVLVVIAGGLIPGIAVANEPQDDSELQGRLAAVQELLREVPLIDGHNDTPWEIRAHVDNRLGGFDFNDTTVLESPMQTDIQRLRAGGVGGVFWSVWVPTELSGPEAVAAVIEQIDLVHRLAQKYPEDLEIALTAADVRRVHAGGRIASLIGAEGGHCLNDSLAVLRQLYGLGVRYLTLTHWDNTTWADAATDAPQHDGLTDFGRAVVGEMNRLGMIVDLSHVSPRTMADVLAVTRAPIIFSHSGAVRLNPHPRNVPEDILGSVAENGGVVMVDFVPVFLSHPYLRWRAAAKAEKTRLETFFPEDPAAVDEGMELWNRDHMAPTVSVSDVADHIDEVRRVAGIDHVGIGSDFDGMPKGPVGLEDVSGYPLLLAELLDRGYSREDVAKVAGLNVLRVMGEVERVAAELQRTEAPNDLLLVDLDGPEHDESSSN